MREITIQYGAQSADLPSETDIQTFARAAFDAHADNFEITIRIVSKQEMTSLNQQYRGKQGPTNVLSFPLYQPQGEEDMPLMGDMVICTDVVIAESVAQQKTLEAHFAHMVVHGSLHLLGFDHEQDADAQVMEAEEARILALLGFANPYNV